MEPQQPIYRGVTGETQTWKHLCSENLASADSRLIPNDRGCSEHSVPTAVCTAKTPRPRVELRVRWGAAYFSRGSPQPGFVSTAATVVVSILPMVQRRDSALYYDTCDICPKLISSVMDYLSHFLPLDDHEYILSCISFINTELSWWCCISTPNGNDFCHTSYLHRRHHQFREPSDSTDGSSYLTCGSDL